MSRSHRWGDTVEWTSKGYRGTAKEKRGVIVAIVPPSVDPQDLVQEIGLRGLKTYGRPRRDESYLVRVGNKIYWPKEWTLIRVNGREDGTVEIEAAEQRLKPLVGTVVDLQNAPPEAVRDMWTLARAWMERKGTP